MASIRKRSEKDGGGYQVRYLGADGRGHAKTFKRSVDALRFSRSVETDISRGQWLDPQLGRVTFGEFSGEWCAANLGRLKPSTSAGYESLLRTHLEPFFGPLPLQGIRRQDVERFLSERLASGLSPARTGQCLRLLKLIMNSAVDNGHVANSPAAGVRAPRSPKREMRFLSPGEIARLGAATPPEYQCLVNVLAYTGIRWGEATALRWGRVDLIRRRLEVRESASEVGGQLHFGLSTKTDQARSVPLPGFLADLLASQLSGREPDDLVFTTLTGRPLRNANFRAAVWLPALERAGLPTIRIHDLRHSCASMLIAAGHSPKSVQLHLGHSSIAITLDTYTHLFPDEQDRVGASLDALWRAG